MSVDPDWAAASGAILYLVPHNEDQNQTFLDYVAHIVEGPRSFANRREIIDEYGWRNFGDLYADHEAVNHTGPGPFISHYNNQYDFVQAAFIYALRTADQRWYDLLNECACHTMDIDIYHTDEDKAGFNHGNFWHTDHYREAATSTHRSYSRANKGSGDYGGGPANEHNYSSGLLHYYYLTGDRAAGEAVLELASYVLNADDGRLSLFALIDDGPTGLSSQTADTFFHKPGRGSGNSINTLMDAYRLSNDRRHLRYAETLIQRVIHPADEISALELDEPEVRWSYLAFMQTLGKYLELKCELGEMDYAYFYARDSFLHYVEWMLNHEVPYKEVLHKTLLPTETWPAHDMRKCHIFHVATKFGAPGRCSAYRTSADLFFERSLDDVMSFDTALLARPMIIIAGYGYIHSYFQKNPDAGAEFPCHSYDFGRPQVFVPQRARLKSTFSRKLTHSFREAKRIVVAKLYGVLDRRRK